MKKRDKKQSEQCDCGCESKCDCGCGKMKCCGGAIYGLGFIGACVYYIMQAPTFWTGVLGVLKAIVWPAMLVFKLLGA